MMVYVERRAADDVALIKDESFGAIRNQLCTFREGELPLASRWDSQNRTEPDGLVPTMFIRVVGVPVYLQVMTTSPTGSTSSSVSVGTGLCSTPPPSSRYRRSGPDGFNPRMAQS